MAVLTPSGRASAVAPRASLGSVRRSVAGQRTPLLSQTRASSFTIHETTHYVLSSFGPALPVEVREGLQRRTGGVSLDPSGWGIVMTTSTIFLWYLSGSKTPQWVELPLPLGEEWSTELVCVCGDGLVAVTSQGAVVGWMAFQRGTAAACHGLAPLVRDDRVRSIVPLQGRCVLGTVQGHLYVVTLQEGGVSVAECGGGESSVGMLSFFSRRVSSLLFRGPSEQKLQCLVPSVSGEGHVLVLFERSMQLRSFLPSEEKVLYEFDLSAALKTALVAAMLPSSESSDAALLAEVMVVECVDVCEGMAGGVVLLVIAGNPLTGVDMQLYLAVVEKESNGENPRVGEIINLSLVVSEEDGAELLGKYRVLQSGRGRGVLMYAPDSMLLCDLSSPGPHQAVPVDCSKIGQLLGTGCYGDHTLIVSSSSGVVSVTLSSVAMETTPVRSVSMETSALPPMSRVGTPTQSRSDSRELQSLKQAFALFCEHKKSAAEEVCRRDLPPTAFSQRGESRGDAAVVELSKAIIDDYPAADPRWAESGSLRGSASQRSVIIQYQLQDKQFVHKSFLEFLRGVGLWACLTTRQVRGCHIKTADALREHGEKLAAAVAVKDAHSCLEPLSSHSLQGSLSVVDQGIKRVLRLRKISSKSNRLTDQDLFYQEVSRVDELLWALATDLEEVWLASGGQPSHLWALHQCASVCKALLEHALSYRREFVHVFLGGVASLGQSWTADTSTLGVRMAVCSLLPQLFNEAGSAQDTDQLWRLAAELVELVLSEYTLQSPVGDEGRELWSSINEEFQKESRTLIEPFVRGNQLKLAIALAEKFHNFPILVEVCVLSGDQHQLLGFVEQFQDQGFAEVLYKYYLEEGQYSVLFAQPVEHHPLLQQFLADHDRPDLQWIHSVNSRHFMDAASALGTLSREEHGLARRKTLLSMEKLCLLAAGSDSLDQVDRELKVVAFQENLPLEVGEGDAEAALPPEELVKKYTSDGQAVPEEQVVQNFMCALDLINLVYEDRPMEYQQLKTDVWVRALLRDSWCELGMEEPVDPLKVLSMTFFFKLMEAILQHLGTHQQAGTLLSQYTVKRQSLLEDDRVAELAADTTAMYLLQAGYEHIDRKMAQDLTL